MHIHLYLHHSRLQIGDPKAAASATASKRSCVRAYPTAEREGLLFAWLDESASAAEEAAATEPYMAPQDMNVPMQWHMTENQTDYITWLEQAMDPTHANYLHHSTGFPMNQVVPMEADIIPASGVTAEGGFRWQHGGYTKHNEGMKAVRDFVPPSSVRWDVKYSDNSMCHTTS